jgi:hypothetical protein
MSMVGDFIDISLERVDAVNRGGKLFDAVRRPPKAKLVREQLRVKRSEGSE